MSTSVLWLLLMRQACPPPLTFSFCPEPRMRQGGSVENPRLNVRLRTAAVIRIDEIDRQNPIRGTFACQAVLAMSDLKVLARGRLTRRPSPDLGACVPGDLNPMCPRGGLEHGNR